jgi:hypothetical protein
VRGIVIKAELKVKGMITPPYHIFFTVLSVLACSCFGEEMLSGFIDMTGSRAGVEKGSQLFYWFTPAQHPSDNTPLLIWLQGGPGSEGELGLFFEIGPYYLTEELTLVNRTDGNWNKVRELLLSKHMKCDLPNIALQCAVFGSTYWYWLQHFWLR